jgi:hypothetical protein
LFKFWDSRFGFEETEAELNMLLAGVPPGWPPPQGWPSGKKHLDRVRFQGSVD